MTKKASLNLSINAIVVLILAITMLGLGLGFMKTMFGQAVGEFENVAGEMKNRIVDELESSDERLTLNSVEVDMKRGSSKDIFFGIKNEEKEDATITITSGDPATDAGKITESGQASGAGLVCFTNFEGHDSEKIMDTDGQIKFSTALSRFIEKGDVAVQKLTIQATSAAELSTYSCAIALESTAAAAPVPYAVKYFNINVK